MITLINKTAMNALTFIICSQTAKSKT